MASYNAIAHSEAKIREILAAACQKDGWKTIGNAYKVERFIAVRYLTNYFTNLPKSTATAMLDNLILEGIVISAYENKKYYVLVPF